MANMSTISIGRKPSNIIVTDAAASKVAELLNEESEGSESLFLRIAVKPGGCSGFSYDMFFDSEVQEDDTVADFSGVKVAIDAASLPLIKGSTLEYKDGLQGAGFHITNPNATRTCGCGSSFS
ncbi:MAG: iron-sulfur cluster insertion protein ErpA [Actinomycetota bacterium]|jgi:iron-sulfur cluster assembly protein/iron-sulfur cluster insertion protein|nr:iron-sulfur cluster insertion protein ErpA [Actinomycetota bacterium]